MKVPTNIICLDWETYYDKKDYTLKKLSTTAYVRDPRFLIHGAAVRWNNEKKSRWMLRDKLIPYLKKIDWKNTALLAHHTHFDGLILTHHLKCTPAYYYDTLSMGRALFGMETGAGLGKLAQFLGIGAKHATYLDEVEGVREPTKQALKILGDGAIDDCDLCWALFRKMLPHYPSDELDLIHYTVKCYTEPVIQVDRDRAMRAHRRVVRHRKALVRRVWARSLSERKMWDRKRPPRFTQKMYDELSTKFRSRPQFTSMLEGLGINPPLKISSSWMKKPKEERDPAKKYTYAYAANDLAFLALREHPDEAVRDLVAAKLVCSSSLHETRPLRMIEHATPALTIYLNYWGARTTGRWSGGDKMNPQNLGRDGELRGAMLAPKGHSFVVGDSASIEPVMNGWLAQDWELMEQFSDPELRKRGEDPYTLFATSVYGRTITKKDKTERFVGKVGIIGLGYQMGAAKLQFTFETGMLGPVLVLDQPMYKRIVDLYRRQRKAITDQWNYFQYTVIPGMMKRGYDEQYQCLEFGFEQAWMPNEMALHYPNLRHKETEDEEGRTSTDTVYRENTKLYGGKFNENIIQALSRIVVGEQYLRIADKYRMVLLAHDEIVLCVPNRKIKQAKHDLMETLCSPPDWCPDAPLGGEVGVFERYVKM
jgi:DNA polymerase